MDAFGICSFIFFFLVECTYTQKEYGNPYEWRTPDILLLTFTCEQCIPFIPSSFIYLADFGLLLFFPVSDG